MTRLASWLGKVLDGGIHSREDWANILAAKPSVVDKWIEDRAVPGPERLRAIVVLLRTRYPNTIPGALEEWNEIARMPITAASGHDEVRERSLGTYILRPLWDNLRLEVEAYDTNTQEQLLAEMIRRSMTVLDGTQG